MDCLHEKPPAGFFARIETTVYFMGQLSIGEGYRDNKSGLIVASHSLYSCLGVACKLLVMLTRDVSILTYVESLVACRLSTVKFALF